MLKKLSISTKNLYSFLLKHFAPTRYKELHELSYWKKIKQTEVNLSNDHYEYFYTTHFGLNPAYYSNKVILDIGCGPRGSLEWASMASRRIGLDPLANEYLKLGAKHHQMEYIAAPSEKIPLEPASCDAAFSFNSLDHVEEVNQTIKEIKRVVRPGGVFLLLVEVNRPPTACEPHELTPKTLLSDLKPEFICESIQFYKPGNKGIYESIRTGREFAQPEEQQEAGYLSAKLLRAQI